MIDHQFESCDAVEEFCLTLKDGSVYGEGCMEVCRQVAKYMIENPTGESAEAALAGEP